MWGRTDRPCQVEHKALKEKREGILSHWVLKENWSFLRKLAHNNYVSVPKGTWIIHEIFHRTFIKISHMVTIAYYFSKLRDFSSIFKTVKNSLIVLARQNKLWEGISSIIKSEMSSQSQLFLSSLGQQPWPQGRQNRQVLPGEQNALRKVRSQRDLIHNGFCHGYWMNLNTKMKVLSKTYILIT